MHDNFLSQKKGFDFNNITGTDISTKMLQVAKEKECYQTLLKLDLTKTLPYLDDTFDNILCVGSTTYLGNIMFLHTSLINRFI